MSSPVETPILARRRLAYGLAELRDQLGWSQSHVARQMKCSNGQVGMIESRERIPKEEFLADLLRLYGRDDLVDEFLEFRRVAKLREPDWRGLDNGSFVLGFDEFVGLERATERIDAYETQIIPGLLQTRDYARCVLSATRSSAGIDRKLDIRMRRQEILTRPNNPVNVWMILEEHALDRPVGIPEIMHAQLQHLLTLSSRPEGNIHLQICPTSLGAHAGGAGSFVLLRFPSPRDPGLVAVETRVRTLFFEEPAEISQFTYELDHLRTIALTCAESAAMIKEKMEVAT